MTGFRRYVLHNLHLKIAALALAVLLWWAIAYEARVEMAFQSPLEFRHAPQGLVLSSEMPTTVLVRVRGLSSALRRLSAADLAVTLNLSGFDRPGERSYPLVVSDIRIPFGVRVVQIVPAQVRLRFEARATRSIPVTPRIVGTVAPGYQLAAHQVFPPSVTVVGPESHVAMLDSATTDPVDVTGVIARAQFWTNAFVADPLLRIQDSQPVRVVVEMKRAR